MNDWMNEWISFTKLLALSENADIVGYYVSNIKPFLFIYHNDPGPHDHFPELTNNKQYYKHIQYYKL